MTVGQIVASKLSTFCRHGYNEGEILDFTEDAYRVARLHKRIVNQRRDFWHKVTR